MKGHVDEMRLATGAMAILGISVAVLVVMPYLLLRDVPAPAALKPYSAEQLRGRQVYIANGCVYCHSQQPRDVGLAPDALRGWGRASVAADYHFDQPHLLGTMRTGPDLFNIAARQPSDDWHLGHLYQPRAYTAGSTMPGFPFLFTEQTTPSSPGQKAINLPPAYAKPGVTVLPTQDARDLVAYLLALDHTYAVIESPKSLEPVASGTKGSTP
jgi:cytochrome c oxidase cbb3-type subunit 2